MDTPPSNDVPLVRAGSVSRLFGHAGIYALGTLALSALSALFTPILTVLLVPAALGVWSLGMSVFNGLSQIYTLALHGAVTRYYYHHEHDALAQRRFQATVSTFILLWSLGLSSVLLVFGPGLLRAGLSSLPFYPYGLLVVGMCLLSVFSVVPKAVWQAEERPKALVGVELAASAISLVGSLVLVAFTSIGVLGLFWGRLLSLVLIAAPCLVYAARRFGFALHGPSLKSALFFSLPLVPHLLAHWVLAMSDRILIERMLGIAAVGIYASAYAFIETVNTVAQSLNRAWVPQFTRAYADETQRPFVARSIRYFMLAIVTASACLFVLSPTLIRLLFSAKYQGA
ncbi:MAG TPA: oligosaccharide flippase family protein, partial [Polyangiaceae bacterium]|nr:oligosaccharide flippase family protein [Polyangiaceae bacterium]